MTISNGRNQDSAPGGRLVACLDNRVGFEVLKFLIDGAKTEVASVITHPAGTALYRQEIASLCADNGIPIWDIEQARSQFSELFQSGVSRPDFLLSIYFDYILDSRFLDLPKSAAINLHPGYLPYNKGFFYYIWATLDGTPAGVSIHLMDEKADAGDIISQSVVHIDPTDTGESLYRKHEEESLSLFKMTWPSIATGTYKRYRQRHPGTRHSVEETLRMRQLNPYETTTAVNLIKRLRMLSFAKGGSVTIELEGNLYSVELSLKEVSVNDAVTPLGSPKLRAKATNLKKAA